jgi:hypothetical protein
MFIIKAMNFGMRTFENLNKDERGVYQMLDTLQTKQIQAAV